MSADAVVIASSGQCVDLEIEPKFCEGCAGHCIWRRLGAERLERVHAGSSLPVGTKVSVSLSDRKILMAALLLHGLPLAAIVAGAAVGAALTGSDTGTLLGALISLVLAVICFKPVGRKLERRTLSHLLVIPKQ